MKGKMVSLADALTGKLAALQVRAQAMQTLAETVRAALPATTRPHVIGASMRGETTLVVLVDSGAWGAQVRLGEHELRAGLAAAGHPDFGRLWVRVSSPSRAAA